MNQYRINLKGAKTKDDFYSCIIKDLKLPEWCGKNPDAIWDMLTGYMEREASIYIEGIESCPKALKNEMKIFCGILDDAKKLYDGNFKINFIS